MLSASGRVRVQLIRFHFGSSSDKITKPNMNNITTRCSLKLISSRAAMALPVLGCAAALVLLAGCSSVKTRIDEHAVHARTFSFLKPVTPTAPSGADNSQQAHARVQEALIKNLGGKGLSYVPAGGDVTVAYLVIVRNNVATTSLNTYFGYTEDATKLRESVHEQETGRDSRAYFESGTLVIDFVDPKTQKVLQRRSVQAEILRNLPMENRVARLQAVVDDALKDVSIAQ